MRIYIGMLLMFLVFSFGCVKETITEQPFGINRSAERNVSMELMPVYYLGYSSFLIQETENSTAIYFNPYNIRDGMPKADYILITNPDSDVCSFADVEGLLKSGTMIITTPDCKEKLTGLDAVFADVEPGSVQKFEDDIIVIATPAYNVDPEKGHPQEKKWVGFFIKYHGRYYFHAGDTDYLPFMKELGRVYVAMLPINGIDSMSVEDAINATYDIDALSSVAMDYLENTENPRELEEKWLNGVEFGFPFILKPYE